MGEYAVCTSNKLKDVFECYRTNQPDGHSAGREGPLSPLVIPIHPIIRWSSWLTGCYVKYRCTTNNYSRTKGKIDYELIVPKVTIRSSK